MAYKWNPHKGQYYDPKTGRFVSRAVVDGFVDREIARLQAEAQKLTADMSKGNLALEAWANSMRALIKRSHLAIGMLGAGGKIGANQNILARIGGILRGQFRFLDRWVDQLKRGIPATAKALGQLQFRADMYISGARRELYEGQLAAAKAVGKTKKRRVLGEAEHCDDCKREAGLGWVDIGDTRVTIPGDGNTVCLTKCQCQLRFK